MTKQAEEAIARLSYLLENWPYHRLARAEKDAIGFAIENIRRSEKTSKPAEEVALRHWTDDTQRNKK
jgi:hypothetical protein